MEELLPLQQKNKKKFEKKVKGIQHLIKEGKIKVDSTKATVVKKPLKDTNRGVVYLGHIPHGFFEDQLRGFFGQFGKVTNVRVARSKKNGKSKGYAFIQFRDTEVAQIAAETMHNYLMDKRLLKAEYIPPDKQKSTLFKGKNWITGKYCPGIVNKMKNKAAKNKTVTDAECLQYAKKTLKKIRKIKESLKNVGVDYDFFQPCDVPLQLISHLDVKNNKDNLSDKDTGKNKKMDKTRNVNNGVKKSNLPKDSPAVPVKTENVKKTKKVDARKRLLLTHKVDQDAGIAPKKDKINKMKDFGGVTKKDKVTSDVKLTKVGILAQKESILKSNLVKVVNPQGRKGKLTKKMK